MEADVFEKTGAMLERIANIFNGPMAIPNVIAIIALSGIRNKRIF